MNDGTVIRIPTDTELIVELLDDIDTDRNREGDRFKARIISPSEISGAIIEGRISKIQKPGRIKRRAEMLLSFDRVVLSENRWSNFSAIVTDVLPRKGDNVKRVDIEGTVEGKRTVKEDSVKVSAAAGTGLVIGAIAGGPVGAAVGASVGAAFGVGAVVVERGKHIRLDKDQQLRIKSSYETQIR
jgi:type IV secretion system protein VirB10